MDNNNIDNNIDNNMNGIDNMVSDNMVSDNMVSDNMVSDNITNTKKKIKGTIKLQTFIMYYHTIIRNVGLYTSISVALFTLTKLISDNYFYKKSRIIKTFIRIISILILLLALYMCFNLFLEVNNMKKNSDILQNNSFININSWYIILILILFILSMFLFICIFVTYKHFVNKNKFTIL